MAEPDIIESRSRPGRQRRRWGWAVAVSVLAAVGVAFANSGRVHPVAVHPMDAAAHSAPPGVAVLVVYGFGFSTNADQQTLSLSLGNLDSAEIDLSAPVVSPTPGVTVVSIGFSADKDPTSLISPTLAIPTGGTGQFVVQYKVDCAAVRLAWPYLGDLWVRLTDASGSRSVQLRPPPTPPGSRPSPLPCTASSS